MPTRRPALRGAQRGPCALRARASRPLRRRAGALGARVRRGEAADRSRWSGYPGRRAELCCAVLRGSTGRVDQQDTSCGPANAGQLAGCGPARRRSVGALCARGDLCRFGLRWCGVSCRQSALLGGSAASRGTGPGGALRRHVRNEGASGRRPTSGHCWGARRRPGGLRAVSSGGRWRSVSSHRSRPCAG